ncbi:MAG: MarR family transcriptional regulator [Comamonadaceae bacterium]|jgi:DNA-binding MarR family transcriptional regulator|nr:MarR family transcriptional regulator [Comamonadaceae bacterium]
MPKTPPTTPHKQLLRHLLMARSDWMEARVVQGAHLEGYPQLTTAMNRLFAQLGGRPLGLSELARRLGVSRQAVHKLALEAERLGLVEFVPSEEDGRVKLLRFSQKGWRMSEEAAAAFVRMEEELARHIGQDNVEELRRILALPWPERAVPESD